MQFSFTLALFGILAVGLTKVTCLTNREVVHFLSLYGKEVEPTNEWADDDTVDDGVIVLSGGLDDQVDVDYVLQRLGLQPEVKYGFWRHHHHKPKSHCSCSRDECKCCIKHTFKFWGKHFELEACMKVTYDPANHHVTLEFTLNGHTLYKHQVSLAKIFKMCFQIPGLGRLGTVCLELYDVHLANLHACARLTGEVNLIVHKFKFHLNLGCFSIPKLDMGGFVQLASQRDSLRVDLLTEKDENQSHDPSENFRNLASESDEDDTPRYEN